MLVGCRIRHRALLLRAARRGTCSGSRGGRIGALHVGNRGIMARSSTWFVRITIGTLGGGVFNVLANRLAYGLVVRVILGAA